MLPTIPPLPAGLDPTRRVEAEHAYSNEAMEQRAVRLSEIIEEARTRGVACTQHPEFKALSVPVAVWLCAGDGISPMELEALVGRPVSVQERFKSLFDSETGQQFLTLDEDDRQKMVTQVGVDFD